MCTFVDSVSTGLMPTFDVRAREQHKLTGVGRVGQDFLVSVVVVVVQI